MSTLNLIPSVYFLQFCTERSDIRLSQNIFNIVANSRPDPRHDERFQVYVTKTIKARKSSVLET